MLWSNIISNLKKINQYRIHSFRHQCCLHILVVKCFRAAVPNIFCFTFTNSIFLTWRQQHNMSDMLFSFSTLQRLLVFYCSVLGLRVARQFFWRLYWLNRELIAACYAEWVCSVGIFCPGKVSGRTPGDVCQMLLFSLLKSSTLLSRHRSFPFPLSKDVFFFPSCCSQACWLMS